MAWQFDRPDLGSGAVFAFRRSEGAENAIRLFLKGIRPEAEYEVTFADTDTKKTFPGKKLAEKGLEVNEDNAPASVLITYESSCPIRILGVAQNSVTPVPTVAK